MQKKLEVWTDGSNVNNGKPESMGGCCAIVCHPNKQHELARILMNTTNNKAELEGIRLGVSFVLENNWHTEFAIEVVTDSAYCEGLFTRQGDRWAFAASKNVKEVVEIRSLIEQIPNFSIRRVKGHRKEHPLNCRADHLAKLVYSGEDGAKNAA